jgi:hypothetical protein
MKSYTNQEINDLAGSALDVACSFIQEQLNVQTGDLAGLFFSGNRKEIIESIFEAYIRSEIGAKNEALDNLTLWWVQWFIYATPIRSGEIWLFLDYRFNG